MNESPLLNFLQLDLAKLEKWQLAQFPMQEIKALEQLPLPS